MYSSEIIINWVNRYNNDYRYDNYDRSLVELLIIFNIKYKIKVELN